MLDNYATLAFKDAGQAPTDMERLVCGILQSEGPKIVSDLVKHAADEMYYEQLRNWGGLVGIGIGGPSLFNRDALALLDAMRDRCLSVEGDNDK